MALFDGIGDWTGHIYADKFISGMKGVTYGKAFELVNQAFDGAKKGKGGVTKNDRDQLVKIVDAFGKQYGIDVSALKTAAKSGYVDLWGDNLNKYSPKTLTGSTTGNIKNGQVIKGEDGYVGNPVGKPQLTPNVTPSTNTNTNTNTSTGTSTSGGGSGGSGGSTGSTGSSGSGGGGGYSSSSNSNTTTKSDKILEQIWNELQEQKAQNKPRTAAELAELYGIDYNEENILNNYNQQTNDYYDTATNDWKELQHDSILANSRSAQLNAQELFNEYKNTAPTSAIKAQLGANALASYMAANYAMNESNYGMNQTINSLEEARKAELANNPTLARTDYNNIGKYLSTLSSNLNASDVQQYADTLTSYGTAYTAKRAEEAAYASGVASRYAGLANASISNSNSAGSNSFSQLYNYYLSKNNGNEQKASKEFTNNLQWSQAGGK